MHRHKLSYSYSQIRMSVYFHISVFLPSKSSLHYNSRFGFASFFFFQAYLEALHNEKKKKGFKVKHSKSCIEIQEWPLSTEAHNAGGREGLSKAISHSCETLPYLFTQGQNVELLTS